MHAIADPSQLLAAPLWERACASFARAVAAIGDPVAVAAIARLTHALRRRILDWLCPLENVVRKLLLAEAAQLRRAETSPSWTLQARAIARKVQEKCGPEGPRSNLDPSRPETWPALFALSPPHDPLRVPEAHAPRIRALWGQTPAMPAAPQRAPCSNSEENSALRLARRLEALRRVLDNPLPHARRLARLFARAIRRFPEIAVRCAMMPACAAGFDPADPRLCVESYARAFDDSSAFRDSS